MADDNQLFSWRRHLHSLCHLAFTILPFSTFALASGQRQRNAFRPHINPSISNQLPSAIDCGDNDLHVFEVQVELRVMISIRVFTFRELTARRITKLSIRLHSLDHHPDGYRKPQRNANELRLIRIDKSGDSLRKRWGINADILDGIPCLLLLPVCLQFTYLLYCIFISRVTPPRHRVHMHAHAHQLSISQSINRLFESIVHRPATRCRKSPEPICFAL